MSDTPVDPTVDEPDDGHGGVEYVDPAAFPDGGETAVPYVDPIDADEEGGA